MYLGNLNAERDWGHAKDYIEGMYLMLQQETPKDYVLATGITTTIRDFVKLAFLELGVEINFSGINENEVGYVVSNKGKFNINKDDILVKVDPSYYRPTEVDLLIGDPTKAKSELGWEPKYNLNTLIKEMIRSDLELFEKK